MFRHTHFELAVLVVMAGIIAYQIFIPPTFGLADNGDFDRFMLDNGLKHVSLEYQDRYFNHSNIKYSIIEQAPRSFGYPSSTHLFVIAARWINVNFIDSHTFDIRVLGAMYTAIYLFGVYLILIACRRLRLIARLLLAGLILLIFTDAGYIGYFNTFYSEPTALSLFLVIIGCAVVLISRALPGLPALAGYFAACALIVTVKPMYAPFAVPFGLFGLYLSRFIGFRKRYWLSGALALMLCALAVWYNQQTPPWLKSIVNYVGLFADLLENSPTPEQDLIEMGLNPEWSRYAGTYPWAADSPLSDPTFNSEFGARVSSFTVPLFYLKRPIRYFELNSRSARNVFITLGILGYYEKESGKPPFSKPFGLWSYIRDMLLPKSLWFLIGFYGLSIAAIVCGVIRAQKDIHKSLFVFYGFLVSIAIMQFMIPVLVLGEEDLARYLLLFNISFDAGLILIAVALSSASPLRFLRKRASTGSMSTIRE